MKLEQLRDILEKETYDAVLLTGYENPVAAKNVKYMTGYTGSFGFAVIGKDYQYFITDFRYRDQVKKEVPHFTFVEIETNVFDALKEIVEKHQITSLGFDQKMRYSEYALYSKLPVTLVPMDDVIESIRVSKTIDEIDTLKRACEITDQALEYALSKLKPGMTERQMEVMIKQKMFDLGADSTWERFIVASGPRGAMPHGSASSKVIESGELVTFDIGCFYQGYSSDLTRTVAVGEVSDELKKMYHIVYEAQKRAVNSARAGMTGKELDAVCRSYIEEQGYGDYFKHGTGHGLGLDVHEAPRVNTLNDQPLEEGACVTIEPGIYITGLGGVRIEDDVILTEDGCIVLNEFPKELITIK